MSNFIRASFDGFTPRGTITRFELRQKYEQHTIAILDMIVPPALLRRTGGALYPEMTPVVLDWGRSATEQARFFGYVNHPEVLTNDSANPIVRYFCLGTSLRMNGTEPRAWAGVSPSFVAAEIARKHRMRALLHRSRRTLNTFTLRVDTDFQALQRLAAESGFRSWVDGGTMLFVDPNVLLLSAASMFVPQYTNISEFSITPGTLVPREGGVVSEAVVNGRSIATRRAFRVKSDTVLKTRPDDTEGFRPAIVSVLPGEVGTYLDAQERIATANRRHNWLTATVRLPGAPKVRPGSLIGIDGPAVPIDHTGVWHVESTRHVMVRTGGDNTYSTDVDISRNQGGAPDYERTSQLSGTPDVVGCVRRGGVFWESESLDIVRLN